MRAVIFDLDETLFTAEDALHDGVRDLLDILRRLDIKIGALTGGDHRALVRLEQAGIRGHFDGVLCSDHMADPKDPQAVVRLLQLLGIDRANTAFVSHAHSDIILGKHTGLAKTIQVTHGAAGRGRPRHFAEADHVVKDVPAVLDVLE